MDGAHMKKSYNQLVPAVDEAARILFHMASQGRRELTLTSICESVGIHKPKGLSILNTLASHGLVAKDHAVKTWSLGPALLTLSHSLLDNTTLGSLAEPALERLAAESGGTSLFCLVTGESLVVVARREAEGYHSVTIRAGHRYPLDWGAHGDLFSALEKGGGPKSYGVDLGKMQRGVNAVAAAVYGKGREVAGCLLVIGPWPESEAARLGEAAVKEAEGLSEIYGAALMGQYGEWEGG